MEFYHHFLLILDINLKTSFMKSFVRFFAAVMAAAIVTLGANAQESKVKVSILGDSYSTFEGYIVGH